MISSTKHSIQSYSIDLQFVWRYFTKAIKKTCFQISFSLSLSLTAVKHLKSYSKSINVYIYIYYMHPCSVSMNEYKISHLNININNINIEHINSQFQSLWYALPVYCDWTDRRVRALQHHRITTMPRDVCGTAVSIESINQWIYFHFEGCSKSIEEFFCLFISSRVDFNRFHIKPSMISEKGICIVAFDSRIAHTSSAIISSLYLIFLIFKIQQRRIETIDKFPLHTRENCLNWLDLASFRWTCKLECRQPSKGSPPDIRYKMHTHAHTQTKKTYGSPLQSLGDHRAVPF